MEQQAPVRRSSRPWARHPELYCITIDRRGFFHTHPNAAGGPFPSLGEAWAAAEADLARENLVQRGAGMERRASVRLEYRITIDRRGIFHTHPWVAGGPFLSLGEALAAAEAELVRQSRYPVQSGPRQYASSTLLTSHPASSSRFPPRPEPSHPASSSRFPPRPQPEAAVYRRIIPLNVHRLIRLSPWSSWDYYLILRGGLLFVNPPDVGGPFLSLSEATAAIKCHRSWVAVNKLLFSKKDYYFTLKDGLFRAYPYDVGGPFKLLEDATYAVEYHRVSEQERHEKNRKLDQYLDQMDPVVYMQQIKELEEIFWHGKRDSVVPKPEKRSWMEDIVDSLEPKTCDPAILEEADRIERILEEKELIKNGMEWMETEVLEAFGIYKSSSNYRGPKYEFVKLDQQCLIHDSFSNSYHHYNFTMRRKSSFYLRKKREKRSWEYQSFFAEVKLRNEGKQIFCRPLQPNENGHCFGCRNVGIDLRHPTCGGYEKGQQDSGFPFDSFDG